MGHSSFLIPVFREQALFNSCQSSTYCTSFRLLFFARWALQEETKSLVPQQLPQTETVSVYIRPALDIPIKEVRAHIYVMSGLACMLIDDRYCHDGRNLGEEINCQGCSKHAYPFFFEKGIREYSGRKSWNWQWSGQQRHKSLSMSFGNPRFTTKDGDVVISLLVVDSSITRIAEQSSHWTTNWLSDDFSFSSAKSLSISHANDIAH